MIKYLLLSIVLFLYYFFAAFLLGTLFLKKIKIEFSMPLTLIAGRFIYFILFNLAALPMKLCFRPLSELTGLWTVGSMVLFLTLLFQNWKYLMQLIKDWIKSGLQSPLLSIGILLLFLIQFGYIGSQTAWAIGVTDDMYYIGDITTSIYSNTIQQYHYMTGGKYGYLNVLYLLPMYPVHSAVMCQLTGLPPLIENKWVLTGGWLLLIDGMYFLWGNLLFRGNRKKCLAFMAVVTWVYFCQRKAIGFFAMEMVYRTAEGKTLLGNLVIPFLFYIFAQIVIKKGRKQEWRLLFVTVIGSFCLVMSSMFILPFVLGSFFICYILLGKRWGLIRPAIVCILPCVVVVGIYILELAGILIFYVP